MTTEQIEEYIARIKDSLGFMRVALRRSKQVPSDFNEVRYNLKLALNDLKVVAKSVEDQWLD